MVRLRPAVEGTVSWRTAEGRRSARDGHRLCRSPAIGSRSMSRSDSRGGGGPGERLRRWLFLDGDRPVVAVALSGVVLLALVLVGTRWEFEMERLVTETRAVQTLFNTLLGGVILFVSVVLSINTAVISEDFGPLRTKRAQVEESVAFRTELAEYVGGDATPTDVDEFFRFVVRAVREETDALRDGARATDDGARREAAALAEAVSEDVARIEDRLRRGDGGVSPTLLAGVDFDYGRHIDAVRRLRARRGADLSAAERESLDGLVDVLTFVGSGQEYFTSLYYRRELRNLSASLLVLSLPVIVFTSFVLLAIDAGLFPSVTLPGIEPRLLYVSVAFVVALSPYVLLTSYMLRVLAVSKRSLAPSGLALETEA